MTVLRRSGTIACLFASLAVHALGQERVTGGSSVELLRCGERTHNACFRAVFPLTLTEPAERLADGQGAWIAEVGGFQLSEVRVRPLGRTIPEFYLLVLVDVSGSMVGPRIQDTRVALRAFLDELPDTNLYIAIAPFASRGVAEGIERAKFGTPDEARRQLERLPRPSGNTGLYSAMVTGASVLGQATAAARKPVEAGLLVITDGRNDVGNDNDDPGLLSDRTGRESAISAMANTQIRRWVIGVGPQVDASELRALAGPRGSHYLVSADPYSQAEIFNLIRISLLTAHELTAQVPDWLRPVLAKKPMEMTVSYDVDQGADLYSTRIERWRPPLFGLPLFTGVVEPGTFESTTTGRNPWGLFGRRTLLFVASFLGLAILWIGLPPLIWRASLANAPALASPRVGSVALAAQYPAMRAGRHDPPPGSADGVLLGVQEAPPRRPSDVTASPARRVVRRT